MSGEARRIYVNPADPTQRYILWTNGFIDAIGGAPAIPQADRAQVIASPGSQSPTFNELLYGPVAALAIIDWDTPAGYTLDQWGFVYPWGGVDEVAGANPHTPFTDGPEFLFGSNGGFAAVTFGNVADFVMDPAANGKGYFLQYDANVIGFGTAPSVTHTALLAGTGFTAWRLLMDWSSKRYWVMDRVGRIIGFNGGSSVGIGGLPALTIVPGLMAPGFALYDLSATPKGWMLDIFGNVYKVDGAEDSTGQKVTPTAAQWKDIGIIDDGTGDNPLRLVAMTSQGTMNEWVSSTAPSITVTTPANPTEDTTRPYVGWVYHDPQGDAQASFLVRVFTSAVYGGGGFNPDTSVSVFEAEGTSYTVRRVQLDFDIENGTYRAYVKASDTSGLSSGWQHVQWVQDVEAPAGPSVTATAGALLAGVDLALHVDPSGLDPAALFAVQFSDDAGVTWEVVAGGDALVPDGSGDATATDLEAGFGILRTYRAIVYIYDAGADLWSSSGWSDTDTATLPATESVWALTNPADPSMGGSVLVGPAISFKANTTSTVFYASGRPDPIVTTDGAPKLPAFELSIATLAADQRAALDEIIDADATLLLRDPMGNRRYVRTVDALTSSPIGPSHLGDDLTGFSIPFQQVRRPRFGPTAGPLAGL